MGAVPTSRRDVEGGLEIHKIPHMAAAWLVSRAQDRDAWLAADTGAWRTFPPGLTETSLPRRRNAAALRALLLTHVPDWRSPPLMAGERGLYHPDREAWARAVQVVRMADTVGKRRLRGLCPGCGLRPGLCRDWEPRFGPRYTAEELAWAR